MRNQFSEAARRATSKALNICLIGLVVAFMTGCGGAPSGTDGTRINAIVLPTDTVLNLACENVGINSELCVLDDPDNPFLSVAIREFDANDPNADNKFDLANAIPVGPTGAKARFYLWATALARRQSGENQWYTARALHELFDANEDPLLQAQALKAYRSVLDNFFGSVTFFECCGGIAFPATLNEQVADNLYRADSTGFAPLIPGLPLDVLSLIGKWGYTYRPATAPAFADGLVFLNGG